jgi:hypothetical protein
MAEWCYLRAIKILNLASTDTDPNSGLPKSRDTDRAMVLGNLTNLYRHTNIASLANEASNEAISIFRAL